MGGKSNSLETKDKQVLKYPFAPNQKCNDIDQWWQSVGKSAVPYTEDRIINA